MHFGVQTSCSRACWSCPHTRASRRPPGSWIPADAGMTLPLGLHCVSLPSVERSTCITRSRHHASAYLQLILMRPYAVHSNVMGVPLPSGNMGRTRPCNRGHRTASGPEKQHKGPEAVNPLSPTWQEATTTPRQGILSAEGKAAVATRGARATPIVQEGKGFLGYGLTSCISPGLSIDAIALSVAAPLASAVAQGSHTV